MARTQDPAGWRRLIGDNSATSSETLPGRRGTKQMKVTERPRRQGKTLEARNVELERANDVLEGIIWSLATYGNGMSCLARWRKDIVTRILNK